ncbi:hypothetical protein SAM23877_0540 [Streptomyces ambofaciens ATCC 23877]|uniref:Uncharacterized protein n=1 Tax=Streptomyces ambofaciens (strain ATCC 23877 / 3486 / DSM 40053 / JCM 4204 / NBRC 12836 / NRRL B-2516) TaxID=278992 RepID=A0A0K2AKS3_STRA7|nr:hypothetical protein SAM23877_0540 [Streptomyces ambofaciens ATCC 23877]
MDVNQKQLYGQLSHRPRGSDRRRHPLSLSSQV